MAVGLVVCGVAPFVAVVVPLFWVEPAGTVDVDDEVPALDAVNDDVWEVLEVEDAPGVEVASLQVLSSD